jgi:hypothetical protein
MLVDYLLVARAFLLCADDDGVFGSATISVRPKNPDAAGRGFLKPRYDILVERFRHDVVPD